MSEISVPNRHSTIESTRSGKMDQAHALPKQTGRTIRSALSTGWRFTRHLLEMLAAMFAGMIVLGLATSKLGSPPGDDTLLGGYAYMGLAMTLPMVAWMRRMGHPWKDCWEMSAAMVGPMFAVVLPEAFSPDRSIFGLDSMSVMMVAHGAMIGGMILLMLFRWDVYAHGAHCHHASSPASPVNPSTLVADPVCGMSVDSATATLTATFEGETYYFCSPACKKDFEEDPSEILAAAAAASR
jgi:YHS domain-containing protein